MLSFSTWPAILTALLLLISAVESQKCYYPDGSPSPVDQKCPGSDLCCAPNWTCLSSGLCHYEPEDLWERRTCADRSWNSTQCPSSCKYSAAGNEAIKKCPEGSKYPGKHCCNGDSRLDCCSMEKPPGEAPFILPVASILGTVVPVPSMANATSAQSLLPTAPSSSSAVQSTREPLPIPYVPSAVPPALSASLAAQRSTAAASSAASESSKAYTCACT